MSTGSFTMLRYLGGGSDKFYAVYTFDNHVVSNYGRNGTSGQVKIDRVAHGSTAQAMARKKVDEKLAKGYSKIEDRTFVTSNGEQIGRFLAFANVKVIDLLREAVRASAEPVRKVNVTTNASVLTEVQGLLKRANDGAALDELLERWGEVSALWTELADEYEKAKPLIAEAQLLVSQRLMGGL